MYEPMNWMHMKFKHVYVCACVYQWLPVYNITANMKSGGDSVVAAGKVLTTQPKDLG